MLLRISNRVGLFGVMLLTLSPLLAAVAYRGDAGESFSFLTHTLSELGRYEVSQLALLVNGGLFFGGLSLVVAFVTRLWLVSGVGFQAAMYLCNIVLALSITAVGLFPVNVGRLHIDAMLFFYLMTFICGVLYCTALWRHPPSRLGLIPAMIAGGLGLSAFCKEERDLLLMDRYAFGLFGADRPNLWWPAFEGWLMLLFVGIWLLFALSVIERADN